MTRPRISILTPCHHQAHVLAQTIESVLRQEYSNLEYIIIDDGSTDESVQIIKQYENKISGWFRENNGGISNALNQGLARCTGDIIAYLQPGQTYQPNALALIADLMSGKQAARWIVGNCDAVDPTGRKTHCCETKKPTSLLSYLCGQSGHLPHSASFWQANVFYDYGYFALDLHRCFDDELNCRLLAYGEQPQILDMYLTQQIQTQENWQLTEQNNRLAESIEVAHRYELMLSIADRIKLIRNIGYRQRVEAIKQAHRRTGASLWAKVITKPWWLASSDIRQALIHREKLAA